MDSCESHLLVARQASKLLEGAVLCPITKLSSLPLQRQGELSLVAIEGYLAQYRSLKHGLHIPVVGGENEYVVTVPTYS